MRFPRCHRVFLAPAAALLLAGCGRPGPEAATARATEARPAASIDETSTPGPRPLASASASSSAAPPPPPPGQVTRVVAREHRACALFESGRLQCWGGQNVHGELGIGRRGRVKSPAWVKGLRGVKQLALGDDMTCAIAGQGELFCWGKNRFLEGDSRAEILEPARVPGLVGVVAVSVGDRHACAVDGAGEVSCWGSNHAGQLGLGADAVGKDRPQPTRVPGLSGVVGVAVAGDDSLAWTRAGELLRWGRASEPGTPWAQPDPLKVAGLSGVQRAWAADQQACALLASREVRCFSHETLADLAAGKQHDFGPEAQLLVRALVPGRKGKVSLGSMIAPDGRGLTGVTEVIVFNHDASALTEQGEVHGWGVAKRGTVGLPERSPGFSAPRRIAGLTGVVQIAGGFMHRCALDGRGVVRCFGSGMAGRLGREPQPSTASAVEVGGLPKITALAASDSCTFALGEDHSLWAWGNSVFDECGLGTGTITPGPARVPFDPSPPVD